MNIASHALRELEQLATSEELELIGLLLSDVYVAKAVRDGDRKMLARVFGVSTLSYEDRLQDRYGIVVRNWTGHFEILQNRRPLMSVEDDVLGTVGTSIIQRCLARDNTNLASTYLAGRRTRASLEECAGVVDREGISTALPQLKLVFPVTTKAVDKVIRAETSVAGLPLPDACDQDQKSAWLSYLSAVNTLYSQLRTNPMPITVEDQRVKEGRHTIGDVAKGKVAAEDAVFRPSKEAKFSDIEKMMLELYELEQHNYVTVDGTELYVKTARDVFSYIGSRYMAPEPLPEFKEVCEEPTEPSQQQAAVPAAVSRAVAPGEPESILRDYYGVDLNKFRDVAKALGTGGLSANAQRLYGELSKAKRAAILRPIEGPCAFREAVSVVAAELGLANDEALAEVVASKIVLAKSAFKVNKATMTVQRL